MPTINDYDEIKVLRDTLNEAAANGNLTPELLRVAFESIDVAGYETIPGSIGANWILRHLDAVGQQIDDPTEFFFGLIEDDYVNRLIGSWQFLELIAEPKRVSFIREVFLRHGQWNTYWIDAALKTGVPRETLAEMVLEKLQRSQVDLTCNVRNFLQHDFLEHGAGRPVYSRHRQTWSLFKNEVTLWFLLDDQQLMAAMRICIAKAPTLFFGNGGVNAPLTMSETLELRLSQADVEALRREAASQLESFHIVNLWELQKLPHGQLLKLMRRVDQPPLKLVVYTALLLGFEGGGPELCEEFAAAFATGDAAYNYRRLWPIISAAEDGMMGHHIERLLHQQLAARGWILAEATKGSYRDRRSGRQREQLEVKHGDTTYVQDRYQHRSVVGQGDWVIIKPEQAQRLTSRVSHVTFYPAHSVRDR